MLAGEGGGGTLLLSENGSGSSGICGRAVYALVGTEGAESLGLAVEGDGGEVWEARVEMAGAPEVRAAFSSRW